MPVIAVVNRKGGSGKTTLATHLAAYCARSGLRVVLADADPQHSTRPWLRRRAAQELPPSAAIAGYNVEPKVVLRPPAGFTNVILDTPGGLRGFELMRIVMYADAILMPVGGSLFDRESTADCYAELRTLPRIASGRCKVALIGLRLDARTKAETVMRDWARALELPFIGVLREAQAYVRCAEDGLTLFDLPAPKVETDMRQWQPIIDWIEPILRPDAVAAARSEAAAPVAEPLQRPVAGAVPASRSSAGILRRPVAAAAAPSRAVAQGSAKAPSRLGKLLGALVVPRFLQRGS